jgi:type I restriction enzyme M protein
MARAKKPRDGTTANLGFEAKLWAAADTLRNNMDTAEYKHVALRVIFLVHTQFKYVATLANRMIR